MATTKRRASTTKKRPGSRGPGRGGVSGVRATTAENKSRRVAAKRKTVEDAQKLREVRRARRERWVANAGAAGSAAWHATTATAHGVGFLTGKVRDTSRRAAPHVARAARAAGWAPRGGWRDRIRAVRDDYAAHGWNHVVIDDWASGDHIPHGEVDGHLGRARSDSYGPGFTTWADRPHAAAGAAPTGGGGRAVDDETPGVVESWSSWWPGGRRRARAWSDRVDAALHGWRSRVVPAVVDADPNPPRWWDTPAPVRAPVAALGGGSPGGVVVPFRPRPALPAATAQRRSAVAETTSTMTLSSLDELLNPEWSQATFQEDVPAWLDQVAAVVERFATCLEEVAELGTNVELPLETRTGLARLSDGASELPPDARQTAAALRDLFDGYEIPKLG